MVQLSWWWQGLEGAPAAAEEPTGMGLKAFTHSAPALRKERK